MGGVLATWLALVLFTAVGTALYLRDDVSASPRDYRLGFAARQPFSTEVAGDGPVVGMVLSREARASGLPPGDGVVAIDGRRSGGGERPIPALLAALGEPVAVTLETISPAGRRSTHRLTSRPEHADKRLVDGASATAAGGLSARWGCWWMTRWYRSRWLSSCCCGARAIRCHSGCCWRIGPERDRRRHAPAGGRPD